MVVVVLGPPISMLFVPNNTLEDDDEDVASTDIFLNGVWWALDVILVSDEGM